MMTTLLIVHGLLAVALLGALTHQALAVLWPSRGGDSFQRRFRAVSAPSYTRVIILLFLATFVLGGMIYPAYRLNVRTYLQDYRMFAAEGAFEIKEHLAAITLGLLPLYWLLWRRSPPRAAGAAVAETATFDLSQDAARAWSVARGAVTALMAFTVWSSFLVGHILNNIRGLFGT